MFSFLKWLIVLACLAGLAYFVFFVPLGERTLYRHLVGISKTDEAQELKDELSKKAQGVKEDVTSKLPTLSAPPGAGAARAHDDDAAAPLSQPSAADRRALEEIIQRDEETSGKKVKP